MARTALRKLLAGWLLGVAFLLLPTTALFAQAQATTGIIRGVVVDPNGSPVGAAVVVFRETQTNFQRSLTADAVGNFAATLLPLGTYDVTARAVGFNEVSQKGIVLRVGQTVELRLAVLPITLQAINVEATQVVVDPAKTELSTRIPVQAIAGLPNNGRNYLNLTLLTPNVAIVQGPDGDELTVAGQRGIHNNVSVDGADFNNPFFGEQRGGQRPAFTFNLDAVQEIVVVSSGAPTPSSGARSGGFVNVITKSGTNQLHGSVHYFGKYDALSGSPSQLRRAAVQRDVRARLHAAPVRLHARRTDSSAIGRSSSSPTTSRSTTRSSSATRPQSAALDSAEAVDGHRVRRRPGERLRPDRAHQRRPGVPGEVRLPAVGASQPVPEVQLHQLAAGERHVRRGCLGRQRERVGEGLLQRRQRQLAFVLRPASDERVPVPVRRARTGPALRRPAHGGDRHGSDRYRAAAVPRHRDGLRQRLPVRDAVLPPGRVLRHPHPAARQRLAS